MKSASPARGNRHTGASALDRVHGIKVAQSRSPGNVPSAAEFLGIVEESQVAIPGDADRGERPSRGETSRPTRLQTALGGALGEQVFAAPFGTGFDIVERPHHAQNHIGEVGSVEGGILPFRDGIVALSGTASRACRCGYAVRTRSRRRCRRRGGVPARERPGGVPWRGLFGLLDLVCGVGAPCGFCCGGWRPREECEADLC